MSDGTFTVCDLNARDPEMPRKHRARDADGQLLGEYLFNPAERKEMPASHALAFVGKDGFEVRDHNGLRVNAQQSISTESAGVQLAEDEVVAQVEELRNDALVKRANALPGGDRFNARSKRDDLVAFVLAGGDGQQPAAEAEGEAEDVVAELDED